MYPISSSRPQQRENEHQAVAVDGAWRGLPGQAVQLSVDLLGLFANPDELFVYVVRVVAGVCPLHLFLNVNFDVKTSTGQVAESAGGESTKLRVDHFPILMSDS